MTRPTVITRGFVQIALAVGFGLLTAPAAKAATIVPSDVVFTCPATSTECAGQTFALWLAGSGASYFDVAFSIDTHGFTGPLSSAFGVEVKDLYDSTKKTIYGSLSLEDAPGGTAMWYVDTTQLSQSCLGKDKTDTACAAWKTTSPGYGYPFTTGEILTWVFRIGATATPDSVGHIKYWYKDRATGTKTGGLLSQDIAVQVPKPPTPVPDGGSTLTLTLFGLGAVGAASRKLKAA